MPIFTCNFPVHLSKYVLELFMWEQSGHHCLLRVIAKALKHVEQRCLSMPESEMLDFVSKGTFLIVTFEEVSLVDLFSSE